MFRQRNGRRYPSSYCKPCEIVRTCAWRAAHPGARIETRRGEKLKRRFGLTLEQYDALWKDQGGVCAGCGGHNIAGRRLAIDHDHRTGKIRGLLCDRCNRCLGSVKDSPDVLRRLANYLEGGF